MNKLQNNDIIEITPQEAKDYCNMGYVLVWIDKEKHRDGQPARRRYKCLGRNNPPYKEEQD